MSSEEEAAAAADVCASCGIAAIDDVKLKKCACGLVKYCSDVCQDNYRAWHMIACKERAAELRDRDLFAQPDESHLGECPICCLPLPLELKKSMFMSCCSKLICNGCQYANKERENEAGLERRCVFCREPVPESQEEADKRLMARIKKNCPVAMRLIGQIRRREGDYKTALEYFAKAAELDDETAHYNLSVMYYKGQGVQKDAEKEVYHLEEAAIGGHTKARHNLGIEEWNNERFDRARKHFIISAALGYHDSLKEIKELYALGHASKEDYADALRAYQAAVDETKSAQREKAEAYYDAMDVAQLTSLVSI